LRVAARTLALFLLLVGVLSAEEQFLVDTTISYQPTQISEYYPSAAFGASEYLVVWQSGRSPIISAT